MAKNRSLEAKRLKIKRRGKYAHRSGGETIQIGKEFRFTRQVINTGRGPNAERMQEYYQRVHSYDQSLPDTVGLTIGGVHPRSQVIEDYYKTVLAVPKEMVVTLAKTKDGALRLIFNSTKSQVFFVDEDYKHKTFKRSIVYTSKETAFKRLKTKRVVWVERYSVP